MAMIARLMVQLPFSRVVAYLDKMLYDNYFCVVKSSQHQVKEVRSKTELENLEAKATHDGDWIPPVLCTSVTF